MHNASLKSKRLLNVLKVLCDGKAHESYELAYLSKNVAISATVAELRANGFQIDCFRQNGKFFYQLKHYLVPCSLDVLLMNIEINNRNN